MFTLSCRSNLAPAFTSSMTVSVCPCQAASINVEFPVCEENQNNLLYFPVIKISRTLWLVGIIFVNNII